MGIFSLVIWLSKEFEIWFSFLFETFASLWTIVNFEGGGFIGFGGILLINGRKLLEGKVFDLFIELRFGNEGNF